MHGRRIAAMSLADDVRADTQVAFAFAGALERALGNDTLLTVGMHREFIGDIFGDEHVRGVVMIVEEPSGSTHEIALVAIDRFAAALEGAASDELLLTTTGPVLE